MRTEEPHISVQGKTALAKAWPPLLISAKKHQYMCSAAKDAQFESLPINEKQVCRAVLRLSGVIAREMDMVKHIATMQINTFIDLSTAC